MMKRPTVRPVHLKAPLRQGLDAFFHALEEQARQRRWTWHLIPCGGRRMAFVAFPTQARERAQPGEVIVLPVDSVDAVTAPTR